ncbi:MAG: ABC transporter substrate-binding protein [Trueperaceae bacterium]
MRRWVIALLLTTGGIVAAQSGTLDIAVDQSPVGLDPHVATAFATFAIIDQVYEDLVELNADLQLEPALAESWEVSDDGLAYTFQLRSGVKFHNGRELTADDVVYSFDRVMAEDTGSPFASRFSQVESAEATGDLTVVFHMNAPFAPFLSNLTDLAIVPREVVEEHGNLQQVAVGTGPFVFDEWVPDTSVLLTANPDYYRDGEPGVQALLFHIVPEATARAAGLRSGTYDFLPDVDAITAQTLARSPTVEMLQTDDLAYALLGLNLERGPLGDPRVRRAINMATDRGEVVDAVYFGDAVAAGPLSPALKDWAVPVEEFACYDTDPDAARDLLAEAGYGDGFQMEILTFSRIKAITDMAQVLQAQYADVGIDASINIEEFGTFVQDWSNSNFDSFASRNGGTVDPDGYLFRTFHSGGSTNVFNYDNPEVDELLERGQVTVDQAERQEIYREVQQILACEGPIVHVAYATLFSAMRDNVEGFQQIPTRSLRYLRNVTVE